jgi:hypothetical protein
MSANYYALLIGANYTATPSIQLKGCINDIVHIKNMLVDAYNYPIKNIIMLRDDSDNPAFHPTYANILAALKQIAIKSNTSSKIWIHFSGHGTLVLDQDNCEYSKEIQGGLEDTIVPCDYTTEGFITQDQIYDIISTVQCPAFITIDACHSGSLCELKWSYTAIDEFKYTRTETPSPELSNKNIYMLSACRDSQTSIETFDTEEHIPMGVFTYSFITCLREYGHNVSILMLYKELCMYLRKEGVLQVPVLSSSSNDLTGYFRQIEV